MRATQALNELTFSFHSKNLIELMVPLSKISGFYYTKDKNKGISSIGYKNA